MPIQIRTARESEFAEVDRVTALAYREFAPAGDETGWTGYLVRIADVEGRARRTLVLVAAEDGRIVGSATLELDGRVDDEDPPLAPDEAHVRMLGVHPAARRRGIARLLMDRCQEEAAVAGKGRVALNTTPRMRAAQIMYERLGFVRGEDRIFPDGFVLMSYSKPLAEPRSEGG